MKRFTLPIAAVMTLVLAFPASAEGDIHGTVKMQMNPGAGMDPCPLVNWFGTVEFSDTGAQDGTYGLVLTSTGEQGVYRGDAYLFEENYTVMTEPLALDAEGVLNACEAGEVVLSGWDAGVGLMPKNEFWDTGYVEVAAGPFDGWTGARTYQDGSFTEFIELEDGTPFPSSYEGTFRLQP